MKTLREYLTESDISAKQLAPIEKAIAKIVNYIEDNVDPDEWEDGKASFIKDIKNVDEALYEIVNDALMGDHTGLMNSKKDGGYLGDLQAKDDPVTLKTITSLHKNKNKIISFAKSLK